MMPPPDKTPSVILKIRLLHKEIYTINRGLPKRDKLGIHSVIENLCVEILSFAVEAAFKPKAQKLPMLEKLRGKITVLKHLIRTEHELSIIKEKAYLRLAEQLIEISKITTGWISYTQKGVCRSEPL